MLPKSMCVVGRYAEELIEKLDSEKANVKEKLDCVGVIGTRSKHLGWKQALKKEASATCIIK
jgi:hypothetical protein